MSLFIQTPRFVIREFKSEDKDNFLALYDDVRVTKHLRKRTKDEYEAIFQACFADYNAEKPLTRWGLFSVDGDYIGNCLLRNFYDYHGKIEVGYSLNHKYWGKGIATELLQVLIPYGFEHSNADEIVAVTLIENISSQKVLLKAGMARQDNFSRDNEELAFFCIPRV